MIFIKYQGNTELCLSTILVREFSGEPDVLTIPRPAYGEPSNKQLGYKRQILSRYKYLCRTDMIYWNIQHNAMMEHTNLYRFWDGNPWSDKSKEIFCDNWIQGWISLVWEKNRIAKWYCSHKSPVIIKLQKNLKNLSRNSDKYYIWEIKARSKEIVQGERSSDSKVASGNKRSGEARKVWFTRFNHFSFLFCFHLLIDWSPSFGYVDVQYVFWP